MKKIISATILMIVATNTSVTLAKNAEPATQAYPTSVNDPITDDDVDFNSIDVNKDGKITLAEAKAASLTEASFKKADTNGDNYVDKEEFLVAFIKG